MRKNSVIRLLYLLYLCSGSKVIVKTDKKEVIRNEGVNCCKPISGSHYCNFSCAIGKSNFKEKEIECMRVTSLFATTNFKLILEFENCEYRLLDIKQFLKNDKGKLAEVRDDIDMFQTAKLDRISSSVVWKNGVDFDHEILYKSSINIDHILGNEGE